MEEGRPPDVRDSLSELEQRLLELERELRADAASDAGVARQGTAVRPQSSTEATARGEAGAMPAGVGAPDAGPEAQQAPPPPAQQAPPPPAQQAPPPPAQQAPPPPSAQAPPSPAQQAPPPPPASPPPPDVGPLVEETQRRVDSLRDSLDGLTGASDRLREVAQTVVEDHGRALVRLERATAQQYTGSADAPEEHPPDQPRPAVQESAPAVPDRRVPEPGEPREPESPERAREEPTQPVPAPDDESPRRRRRRLWLWLVLGPLLIAAGVATALLLYGEDDQPATTTASVPGASSRIALAVDLGPDAQAFEAVPGTREASDIGAAADLCDGVVSAAVILRPAADVSPPPCEGLVTITDGTLSALALAERGGRGGRSCVNAADVPSIAASRPARSLTAARARAVTRAESSARRRARDAGLTAAERVATVHTAAYEAGRRFDSRNGLRLLAVRAEAGRPCIVPGRDDVTSGRYPLANRIELLAKEAARAQPAVERAAVVIDNLTSGPAPINATALRARR